MREIIRRELKFILPKKIKTLVEMEIERHMEPDKHGMEYPVRSLYFKFNSELRHRLRAYSNNENTGPLFFEIKGRGALGKFKRRTEMAGQLDQFIDTCEPSILVGYDRKAFENEGEMLRVTIDENIWAAKATKLFPANATIVQMPFNPVMEVKYKDELPEWLKDMIEDYGLKKASFSKFEKCQEVLNGGN